MSTKTENPTIRAMIAESPRRTVNCDGLVVETYRLSEDGAAFEAPLANGGWVRSKSFSLEDVRRLASLLPQVSASVERGRLDWRNANDPGVQRAYAACVSSLTFAKGTRIPLLDALCDRVAALHSDFGPTPDWRRLRDDIIRSVSELEYNSPDDQPNLLQCTVEELSDILEAVLSDSGEAPATPAVRVPAAGEQG